MSAELITREEWIKNNVKKGALIIGGLFIGSMLTKVASAKTLLYKDSAGTLHDIGSGFLQTNQSTPQIVTDGAPVSSAVISHLTYTAGLLTKIQYANGYVKDLYYNGDGTLNYINYNGIFTKNMVYISGILDSTTVTWL